MTPDELRAFAEEIAAEFNAGHIRAPIHLEGGNEAQLVEIFRDVGPDDWVLCSWRSMSKALLKGVPREEVKAEILRGRSITLTFPEHRFLSSAIAGGCLPIAVGLGMGIKRRGGPERVWCFMGDMCAQMGIAFEGIVYAANFGLPIVWVVEDNGKSVCTPTQEVWSEHPVFPYWKARLSRFNNVKILIYQLPWPHSGSGTRINF